MNIYERRVYGADLGRRWPKPQTQP